MEDMVYNLLRKSIQEQAHTPAGMFLYCWMNEGKGLVRDPVEMSDYPLYAWKDGWNE